MSVPYYPMYPADFEADTSHLTLEEDGAYNRLLRLCWMTPGCSLPDDPAWIARRMRLTISDYERVVEPLISEFFRRKGGRISSPRLTREWEKVDETSRKRSEAGKKGGRPKAIEKEEKHEKAGLVFDKARPKQPEPEPYPEKKEEPIGSSKKPSRAIALPADWVPSARNLSDARGRNFTEDEIHEQSVAFRDYHLARGTAFKDWDAAWRTWLGNARRFDRASGPRNAGHRSPHDVMLSGFQRAAGGKPI